MFYTVPTARVIFTVKTSLDVFCLIGKLGYIDRTTPDPRWASKKSLHYPEGGGQGFF